MTNLVQFVMANKILLIPLTRIEANPFQHRVEYGDIGELADRIAAAHDSFPATMGLMQVPRGRVVDATGEPIDFQKVAPLSERNADWEGRGLSIQLMYGHRRWKAMELLCERGKYPWNTGVMPIQITDAQSRDMLLSVWEENERRQNLTAIEQAHLMAAAKEELGKGASQRDVAEFFGLARPTVANRMSLLDLPEEVQALNRTGKLSERQLLSMKPLYELTQVVEESGRNWGDRPGGWQVCAPQTYIQYIVENPEKYTGDEIREFANKVEQSVGKSLPKALVDFPFAPAGMMQADDPDYNLSALGIEQSICKGCPFRRNSTCLKPSCLQAKRDTFGRRLANQVGSELGLAYNNDKAYFNDMSYEEWDLLKASFDAGHRCDHLVIGWSDEWWGLRPFDPSGRSSGENHYQDRNGILLGHKGKFRPGCLKTQGGAEDDEIPPAPETIEAWIAAAKKQERQIKDRVRLWLIDGLFGDARVKRMFLALLDSGKGLGGTDDDVDKALANFALSRFYHSSDVFSYYQNLAERIEAAGLDPFEVLEYGRNLAKDKEAILKDATIRVLAQWYQDRKRTWGEHREKCGTEIERLIGLVSGRMIGDEELLGLSVELELAAKDIARQHKKEAERTGKPVTAAAYDEEE